jgi:DNA-binding XRE family transcriptional regulator
MNYKQKKDWAELLVKRTMMNQKEIAEKVGVTPKTMSKWWDEQNWDTLRTSFFITKGQELQRVYQQISALNDDISNREQRWATSREADTLSKLASTARALESEANLADTIDVFLKFTDWIREVDFDKAKEINDLMDAYIKDSL